MVLRIGSRPTTTLRANQLEATDAGTRDRRRRSAAIRRRFRAASR